MNALPRLLLTLLLLLALPVSRSLADGINPGNASNNAVNAGISKSGKPAAKGLHIEKVEFIYRADADARYLDLKTQWQNTHHGAIDPTTNAELARRADEASSIEKSLEQWQYNSGPSPNVIRMRVHVYNNSPEARLDTQLATRVRVKVGPLLVNPRTLITDYAHLQQTARWQTLDASTVAIPVLAPGEDKLEIIFAFSLPAFLRDHPGQWPVQLEAYAGLNGTASAQTSVLTLTPDPFTLH